tara:strand:- start:686 stop:2221 length:1536 start_codon:yes stop_codon:yes gene_type:complete
LLVFVIPFSFAEISVTLPDKEVYNLGEEIIPTVSVKEEQEYNGFIKASIICDDFELQYYTMPLSVEAGVRTQVNIAELTLFESMKGQCKIKTGFDATDGEKIDAATSDEFEVASKLEISADGNLEAKPGDEVLVSAGIRTQSNEPLSEGEAVLTYNNQENKINVSFGKVEHTIALSNDAKTGYVPVAIVVKDKYGNYGDEVIKIKVNPIPKRVENRFENTILKAGENIKVRVILYDQNDYAVNGSKINVKIYGPDEKLIVEEEVGSMKYLEFETQENQMPGKYYLLSTFENIEEQTSFIIGEIKKITMEQEGSLIHITNTGNVDYNDEITIILESDGEKYLINKKLKLELLESITIDLSKEVPQGTYDITLPEDAVEESSDDVEEIVNDEDISDVGELDDKAEEGADEISQEVFGPMNVIKDVLIEDNRNVIKKTAGGLSTVTGAVISSAKIIASKPTLASIILVTIILGIITYYNRGFIVNTIKRKKPEDTSELFQDFKYAEDEDSKPGN